MWKLIIGVVALLLFGSLVWYLLFVMPRNAPWEDSGTVFIIARAVPTATGESTVLGLSVDDLVLIRKDGESVRAKVFSKRMYFGAEENALQLVIKTDFGIGSYTGLRFALSGPEERNAWQGDEAPRKIELAGQNVFLEVPFQVEKDANTVFILGFETQQAIHELNGRNVYLPVIQTEIRIGSEVVIEEDKITSVVGGNILGSAMFGMDWNGSVYFNYRAKPNGVTKNTYTQTEENVWSNNVEISDVQTLGEAAL